MVVIRRGAGPTMQKWVTDIRDQCLRAKVPFFFKQWGGVQKKRTGRILEGRTWDEMPVRMSLAKAQTTQTAIGVRIF
jgi:protein gp37